MANLAGDSAPDLNNISGIKSFADVLRSGQNNQIMNQAAQIDNANKANIYKTQVLSAAAGSGDQAIWQGALQHLAETGLVDVSDVPPDIQHGAAWAQAGRLAQSPLGSILGLGMKAEGIQNQALALGTPGGAAALDPLSARIAQSVGTMYGAGTPSPSAQPINAPLQKPTTTLQQDQDLANMYTNPPAVSPPNNNAGYSGASPNPQPVILTPPAAQNTASAPTFSFRPQGQNETADNYNKAYGQAQKTFEINNAASIEGAKTTANKRADVNVDREAGYTKAQSALQGFEQQSNLVTDNVDKALAVINGKGSMATGYGQYLSGLPDTDARKLNNYLTTIKANIGFDRLQQMRDNSKTGGALGQVSDFENKLLQAVQGALDPLQADQLKENLATIKQLYPQVVMEKKRAFDQDYGGYQPIGGTQQPPPADPIKPGNIPNGTIADNPQTGESIIYMNGAWKPRAGMQ